MLVYACIVAYKFEMCIELYLGDIYHRATRKQSVTKVDTQLVIEYGARRADFAHFVLQYLRGRARAHLRKQQLTNAWRLNTRTDLRQHTHVEPRGMQRIGHRLIFAVVDVICVLVDVIRMLVDVICACAIQHRSTCRQRFRAEVRICLANLAVMCLCIECLKGTECVAAQRQRVRTYEFSSE